MAGFKGLHFEQARAFRFFRILWSYSPRNPPMWHTHTHEFSDLIWANGLACRNLLPIARMCAGWCLWSTSCRWFWVPWLGFCTVTLCHKVAPRLGRVPDHRDSSRSAAFGQTLSCNLVIGIACNRQMLRSLVGQPAFSFVLIPYQLN